MKSQLDWQQGSHSFSCNVALHVPSSVSSNGHSSTRLSRSLSVLARQPGCPSTTSSAFALLLGCLPNTTIRTRLAERLLCLPRRSSSRIVSCSEAVHQLTWRATGQLSQFYTTRSHQEGGIPAARLVPRRLDHRSLLSSASDPFSPFPAQANTAVPDS